MPLSHCHTANASPPNLGSTIGNVGNKGNSGHNQKSMRVIVIIGHGAFDDNFQGTTQVTG